MSPGDISEIGALPGGMTGPEACAEELDQRIRIM
jgi:hypothetical protein